MENGWERTLPLVEISHDSIAGLFNGVINSDDISHIVLLNEGCRTTNYMVSSKNNSKYLLKIFYEDNKSYRKDINLFSRIKEYVPVQEIYKSGLINNKKYIIYKYIEGKTISQYVNEGNKITKEIVESVAEILGRIHTMKFRKVGNLNENLYIENELEPIIKLYDKYINENVRLRLGPENINKIKHIIAKYNSELSLLDYDSRLIHGDFQGTNIILNNKSVVAIIDWEFCRAGSPLIDIGQFFRYEEYFNNELINAFENKYRKVSDYKLIDNWYDICKIIDLLSLIQLISRDEEMPNKYNQIKEIIKCSIDKLY
ncbi:phosphotransferase [Clostridium sp. SM-530-WT-3G]|uniref:phosphotransferase n=1 Tax=Clostridium sp. SM-530-WT-3G TaxID=2725303 RepID=UPI00145CC69E|nr:phosphotransferase [Clostridium sp. SM-530-WT-3G]NME83887.1 phosphotransferase [Clostridium sp. SM-530-WT-3G]